MKFGRSIFLRVAGGLFLYVFLGCCLLVLMAFIWIVTPRLIWCGLGGDKVFTVLQTVGGVYLMPYKYDSYYEANGNYLHMFDFKSVQIFVDENRLIVFYDCNANIDVDFVDYEYCNADIVLHEYGEIAYKDYKDACERLYSSINLFIDIDKNLIVTTNVE